MINSVFLMDLFESMVAVLISLLILLIPIRQLVMLTKPFSFKTFGIRKLKRWHSRTDTLGNFFLWVSVFLCVLFPLIPYPNWVYGVWLTFTWLCTLSRAVRMSAVRDRSVKQTVVLMVNLVYGFGLLAGTGLFDRGGLLIRSQAMVEAAKDGSAFHILYILHSPNLPAYLLQMTIMLVPACSLWHQFKYMRLENTYKASSLWTYVPKSLIEVLLIAVLGIYGLPFLENLYQVPEEEKISSIQVHNFDWEEAVESVTSIADRTPGKKSGSGQDQPDESDSGKEPSAPSESEQQNEDQKEQQVQDQYDLEEQSYQEEQISNVE